MRNKDSDEVEIKTRVMVEKFLGEPKKGDKPFETITVDENGNKTIIAEEDDSVGSE